MTSPTRLTSRLVNWSVIAGFKPEHGLLLGVILTALALFFVGGGTIVSLTGWTFIQTMARFVFVTAVGAATLFITYDTIQYYRYVTRLRANGQPVQVVVTDTDRRALLNRPTEWYVWYTYEDTFQFKGHDRVIAVNEADYDRFKQGERQLAVLYNPHLDDFITVNFSAGYAHVLSALCFWFVFFAVIRPSSSQPATRRV